MGFFSKLFGKKKEEEKEVLSTLITKILNS